MKYRKFITKHEGKEFTIEEDNPEVGFYLYIINKNTQEGFDYLLDSIELAKKYALDNFSVPLDSWKEIT